MAVVPPVDHAALLLEVPLNGSYFARSVGDQNSTQHLEYQPVPHDFHTEPFIFTSH